MTRESLGDSCICCSHCPFAFICWQGMTWTAASRIQMSISAARSHMIRKSRHDQSQKLSGHSVETRPARCPLARVSRCSIRNEKADATSDQTRCLRQALGYVLTWAMGIFPGIPNGSFLRFQTGSSFVGCLMSPLCGDFGVSFGFHVSSAHSGTSFVGCLMSPLCKGPDGCTEEQYCLVTYTLFTIEN